MAADSAAMPAVIAVVGKKDIAVVSTTVIFQIRQQPLPQGVNVKPSDLLPSDLDKPCGSLVAGMPARIKIRWIMSLR